MSSVGAAADRVSSTLDTLCKRREGVAINQWRQISLSFIKPITFDDLI